MRHFLLALTLGFLCGCASSGGGQPLRSASGMLLCNTYPDAFCLERGSPLAVTAQPGEVIMNSVSHRFKLSAVPGGTNLTVRVQGLTSDDVELVSIADPGSLLDISGGSSFVRFPDGSLGAERRIASTSDTFITVVLKPSSVGKRYTISTN